VLDRVIQRFGGNWRAGWWLMAGLSLLGALLAVVFIKEKPSDLGQFPDGESAEDAAQGEFVEHRLAKGVYKTTAEWTLRDVFQSGAIWLVLFSSLGISAGYPLVLAHGVVHLKDLGYTASEAAFSIGVMLLAALGGQLIVVAWGDRIEPRRIWAVASAVFGVGMILALNASGAAGLYLYAICLGAGFGASFSCLMTLPGNYYGAKAYASILGVLIAVGTTAGAGGPYLAGKVYDHYGSYAPMFYAVAGLSFAATVVLLLATPPVRRGAESLAPAVE
jgi:cyanate permease